MNESNTNENTSNNAESTVASQTLPKASLPPVSNLIKDSWNLFIKSLLNLFILNISALAISLIFIGIFVAILFALGIGTAILASGTQKGLESTLMALAPSMIILLIIFVPLFIIGSIIIGSIIQSGSILILEEENSSQKISFSQIIRKGFGFVIPLLLTSFLVSIIVFGGFFVFVIPAFVFAMFLIFTPYEVVLGNKRWIEAIKGSFLIVSKNFGEIFLRILVIFGFSFLIGILSSTFSNIDNVGPMFSLVFTLISVVVGWYSIAYYFTLYKQAKATVNPSEKVSLKWVWIVSIIGWIIGMLVIISTIGLITAMVSSGALQKALEQSKKGNIKYNYDYNSEGNQQLDNLIPTLPSGSNEYRYQYNDEIR